jgi:hypothetical protein
MESPLQEGTPSKKRNPDESTVTIQDPDEDSEADEGTTPKKSKKNERPPPDPSDPVYIAERAAVLTAAAETEAAERATAEKDNQPSKLDNCKYYTSLTLGTACIVSVFAFLFLVPFVLDPAISTMTHEFVETAVTCMVSNVSVRHGKSNCLWSSCREGCTADMFKCYQVRVVYSHLKYVNGSLTSNIPDDQWVDLTRFDNVENQVLLGIHFAELELFVPLLLSF